MAQKRIPLPPELVTRIKALQNSPDATGVLEALGVLMNRDVESVRRWLRDDTRLTPRGVEKLSRAIDRYERGEIPAVKEDQASYDSPEKGIIESMRAMIGLLRSSPSPRDKSELWRNQVEKWYKDLDSIQRLFDTIDLKKFEKPTNETHKGN